LTFVFSTDIRWKAGMQPQGPLVDTPVLSSKTGKVRMVPIPDEVDSFFNFFDGQKILGGSDTDEVS